MQTETRQCNRCKNDFILDDWDISFYEKMKVPTPHVCPDCRFKMRAMWRNETTLYSGQKCHMCDNAVVTMYNTKKGYKIFCTTCWLSEKWDSRDYAIDYNKDMPFFEQLNRFMLSVPKMSLYYSHVGGQNINSEYINSAGGCKDCYFCFNTTGGEGVMYSRGCREHCVNSSDLYFGISTDLCYEGVNISKSSGVIYGQNVANCVDSQFILNGSGLTNCFGCVNLRNKSDCWFNEQLTKEEYFERVKEFKGSYSKLEEAKEEFQKFCLKFPHRENCSLKSMDSVGDYLFECKNVKDSFEVSNTENSRYLFSNLRVKDLMGLIGFGTNSELMLETVGTGYSSKIIGSSCLENCQDVLYSFFLRNSKNCIGCDSIKNAEYCILNKQYSKEEYENIKEHIIKELTDLGLHGLIMPPEIAPFAYNETIAQVNLPLTKEEALSQGFTWEDDIQLTKGKETLLLENIPDHIKDVGDSITKEILRCIDCERNYKITEQELQFYKKMILPIPRKCFFCRHKDRIVRRGSFVFSDRTCSHCNKKIHTNLTEETAPIIYCEECYRQEVI